MIDRETERLFRAHVTRCADHLPELGLSELIVARVRVRVVNARDAEIDQLCGATVIRQQDV